MLSPVTNWCMTFNCGKLILPILCNLFLRGKRVRVDLLVLFTSTVKPVLRDHCHEGLPVLTDHLLLAERPTFQYFWTCHQRPPVFPDHIFVANRGAFQERFYCKSLLQKWHVGQSKAHCKVLRPTVKQIQGSGVLRFIVFEYPKAGHVLTGATKSRTVRLH